LKHGRVLGVNGFGAETVNSSGVLLSPALVVKRAVCPNWRWDSSYSRGSSCSSSSCSVEDGTGEGDGSVLGGSGEGEGSASAGSAAIGDCSGSTDWLGAEAAASDLARFSEITPTTRMAIRGSGATAKLIFWNRVSGGRFFGVASHRATERVWEAVVMARNPAV
jgi:hypothetical protein